jgi:C1A family cysteine protease
MDRKIKTYGWIPDLPDARDHVYKVAKPIALPPSMDLRSHCPPVIDQGQLGSCTANALANAHLYEQLQQRVPVAFLPSRLFIYYNERVLEHTVKSDSGASLRDGIKTVNKQGVCPETMWPYVTRKFAVKPSAKCYKTALTHQVVDYQAIPRTLDQFKTCLASGFPFVFGFSVYESFESAEVAKTGLVPMPQSGEAQLGGHAVMAVGFDDAQQRFIVMNSWGTGWGLQGFFLMPYAYLMNAGLSSDFWTIRMVEA